MLGRWPGLWVRLMAIVGAVVYLGVSAPVLAQTGPAGDGVTTQPVSRPRPVAAATRVEQAPVLDGDVLNDPVWGGAKPLTEFWQTTPNEGAPASERTEVRIVYTRDTLYFGVICYDREPGAIIVADSRRDSPLDNTDSFQIVLDTYRDQQNGFAFGTTPSGLEHDGLVVSGEGGTQFGGGGAPSPGVTVRQTRGSEGGFNLNWDGSWQVRTAVSELGWSAEFAIPFRTIRYPGSLSQTWGLNLQRNIRRRNESAFWAPLSRQFTLYRLSLAGQLTSLEVPVQRNLKVTPYVLGEALRYDARHPRKTALLGEVGIDAKYSVTPSLTLDVTYNTDFAQVEVDEEQVNLDRFNLFFPEKRPFFLENAGLFTVGTSGQTEIFFSRAIGVGPGGVAIPILGGARLSGHVAGYSVGLLDMQTEEVPGVAPANNFAVARVRRDLPNRSHVGAIFVNRQATDRRAGERHYNRAYAVDGRLGIGINASLSGFAARSQTPGVNDDDHAYDLGWGYNSQRWRAGLGYTEVADRFNPEVGFLTRRGFRSVRGNIFRIFRLGPERRLHEIRPHVTANAFWNFAGFQETGFVHMDSHWEWKSGAELDTGYNLSRQGVTRAFEIFPGIFVPPGTYDEGEVQLVGYTNEGAPLSVRTTLTVGGFFGGDRVAIAPSMRLRVGGTLNTELSLQRNDIDLPWGSFVTNLIRARVSYSFTPRAFVQGLVQYNDRADLWSANFRFAWLQDANTGLFIVYNDTRGLGSAEPAGAGRSLILKFSRLFDLLN